MYGSITTHKIDRCSYNILLQREDAARVASSRSENLYALLKVNWIHIRAIQHVISMHAAAAYTEFDGIISASALPVSQLSLPYCQSQIPVKGNAKADDWAGVEGTWICSFCFVDHRDLIGMSS